MANLSENEIEELINIEMNKDMKDMTKTERINLLKGVFSLFHDLICANLKEIKEKYKDLTDSISSHQQEFKDKVSSVEKAITSFDKNFEKRIQENCPIICQLSTGRLKTILTLIGVIFSLIVGSIAYCYGVILPTIASNIITNDRLRVEADDHMRDERKKDIEGVKIDLASQIVKLDSKFDKIIDILTKNKE